MEVVKNDAWVVVPSTEIRTLVKAYLVGMGWSNHDYLLDVQREMDIWLKFRESSGLERCILCHLHTGK